MPEVVTHAATPRRAEPLPDPRPTPRYPRPPHESHAAPGAAPLVIPAVEGVPMRQANRWPTHKFKARRSRANATRRARDARKARA